MNEFEFVDFCIRLGLSPQAIEILSQIRKSNPVRRADGGKRSVSTRYASRKMGLTIQAESHRSALAGVDEYENDNNVLEFWDEPYQFLITDLDVNGRTLKRVYTPDYCVIRLSEVVFEEWKSVEQLESLSSRLPNRYYYNQEKKHWECPPAEQWASKNGFKFRIRTELK